MKELLSVNKPLHCYSVVFDCFPKQYIGEINDFPGLPVSSTIEEACNAAKKVIIECIKEMSDGGEDLPKPTAVQELQPNNRNVLIVSIPIYLDELSM